jgi:hypothetical protein
VILRRLVDNLKQHHWTGVFVELVIVVLGVFIGLQVNNWNEARHDRLREHEYLQRIYADMQETIAHESDGSENAQWNQARLASQAIVLEALRSGVLQEKDRQAFDKGLMLFGYTGGADVRWSTVEELQSTGSMAVIRDRALRDLIGQNDANLKRKAGILTTFTNSINGYRQQLGSRFAVARFSDFKDPEGVKLQYDFHALASDPGFINTLTQIDALSRMKIAIRTEQMEPIRHFRDELAKRLQVEGESP